MTVTNADVIASGMDMALYQIWIKSKIRSFIFFTTPYVVAYLSHRFILAFYKLPDMKANAVAFKNIKANMAKIALIYSISKIPVAIF